MQTSATEADLCEGPTSNDDVTAIADDVTATCDDLSGFSPDVITESDDITCETVAPCFVVTSAITTINNNTHTLTSTSTV